MTSEDSADSMSIEEYLAKGGKLTSPDNAPARYRGELLRIMASFVDSELAGSAGFANSINWAPAIKARIAASRIVLEKADHAERVLNLMGDFGTNIERYNEVHDWAARTDRDTRLDPRRYGGDMRLSVFHYPFEDWTDAVVMNVLMGLATVHQLTELGHCSYAPFAEVINEILPRERRHMELGIEGLEHIVAMEEGRDRAKQCVDYWHPRIAETFGPAGSERFERLARVGLRQTTNEDLQSGWESEADSLLARLALA